VMSIQLFRADKQIKNKKSIEMVQCTVSYRICLREAAQRFLLLN